MCDPLSLAVVSTVGALGASGYGMYQQQQAINDQNDANASWRRYQEKQRLDAQAKDAEMRRQADLARNGSLDQLGADKQKEAQTTESARLSDLYDGGNTTVNTATVNDALLSGQESGGEEFKTDVAARLNKAAIEARTRIKALADINSYGGSFNGLGARNSAILDKSGQGVELANNMRRGNLAAYGIAQGVNPQQNAPVVDYASGIGNALSGISGKAWGQYSGGKV